MNNDNSLTILIIDDESILRDAFSDFLEDQGFTTITAENGRVGIEKFKNEKIDLVIVDLRMPEVDGLEVLDKISKIDPQIPLIVISGTGVLSDAIEAMHCGAWDYLMKPINDLAVLKHAIKNNLEKARLKKELLDYQKHLEKMVEQRTSELHLKNEKLEKEIAIRQKTEEKLKQVVQEKSLLVQEIHHRVKNNMAIIVSLLNLKSSVLQDSNAKEVLLDCENRVRAMALVHESLYKRENLQSIKLKDYTTKLVNEVLECYNHIKQKIQVSYNIDDLEMKLNQLTSFGLIINEIITNSAKHAFSEVTDPKIFISIKNKANDTLEVNISDNGNGFTRSDDYDFENTIGFQIIFSLVRQLDGTISYQTKPRVEFSISIPKS